MENSSEVTEVNDNDCVMLDENDELNKTNNESLIGTNDENMTSKSTPSTPLIERAKNSQVASSAEKLNKNLKMQQKLEIAKKRQEEKEKKEREKKEREEQKLKREEEQRKKKEEEERLRQKRLEEKEKQNQERLEKERKRQELINQRNEEKRKRDEEKKKVEDEKKRLEEEKQREEEEKRRKEEKVKTHFVSYFIKKETNNSQTDKEEQKSYRFMPFQLKENMFLAPICRRDDIVNMTSDQKEEFIHGIDRFVMQPEESEIKEHIYLKEIRTNASQIRQKYKATRRSRNSKISKSNELKIDETTNDDIKLISSVNIVPENSMTKFRVKYLHFDPKVYRRPPYYGTWKKKSNIINPRKPFAKDEKIIDYEIDSDDEWEDEADGESIANSDKGDPEEETVNGDDEDDDGFFVPHGHLSDDELDEDERNLDEETKKAKEAAITEQWETERKKTSRHLVPKCFYSTEYWNVPDKLDLDSARQELKHLHKFQMVPLVSPLPIIIAIESHNPKPNEEQTKATKTNAENLSSPNVTGRSKSSKQKNNPIFSTTQSPSNNLTPNNPNKGSIIKFISKLSNKSCKIEQISSSDPIIIETKTVAESKLLNSPLISTTVLKSSITSLTNSANKMKEKSSLPKKADEEVDNIMDTIDSVVKSSNTPSAKLRRETSSAVLNKGSPSTPLNSKPTTGTSTTAEKRACNENGENAVKRLKLDDGQSNTESKSASKASASPTILSLFKNSSCRKNLRLSSCEIDITMPEETIPVTPQMGEFNLKKCAVELVKFDSTFLKQEKSSKTKTETMLSPKKTSSVNNQNVDDTKLIKTDVIMETCDSVQNKNNNKENNEQPITID